MKARRKQVYGRLQSYVHPALVQSWSALSCSPKTLRLLKLERTQILMAGSGPETTHKLAYSSSSSFL